MAEDTVDTGTSDMSGMDTASTGSAGTGEPEPSDSLRTFGAVVHGLREHAGLSREEFAGLVRFSKHTVTSVELGRRMPDPDFVEAAEAALGNTGALRRAMPHLTRQVGLAAWFRQWARLEARAITLWTYDCRVIPGFLQTEAYIRAVTASVPPIKDNEQVDQQVAARLERQALLDRRPAITFSFIVEQAVIERCTGGVEVTREQIDHLLHWSTQFNVEVQVMPQRSPDHAGLDGPLMLLETSENKWFGYAEGQRGGLLVTPANEVSILIQRYAKMRSQALNSQDSRDLLKRLRGAL